MKIKKEAQKNNELPTDSSYRTLKNWRTWVILDLFAFLYVGVLLGYLAFLHFGFSLTSFWGNALALSTSPFNFVEIFSKVYSSPMEGYLLNGVFTVAIITVSVLYYCLFASSKRIKPELVFWTSIVASYIVSIFVWLFTGAPSTGTSIIGFCMVGFLFVSSLNDVRAYSKKNRNESSRLTFVKAFAIAFTTVFSLIFAVLFYSLSNSVYVHFGGGAICACLIFITVKTEKIGNSEITLKLAKITN